MLNCAGDEMAEHQPIYAVEYECQPSDTRASSSDFGPSPASTNERLWADERRQRLAEQEAEEAVHRDRILEAWLSRSVHPPAFVGSGGHARRFE